MEASGCAGYYGSGPEQEYGLESELGMGLGSGSHNETETVVTTSQHPYAFAFLLVQLIGTVAITVPAVLVIATIVYQKLLSKSHYGFVIGLMICDIMTALSFSLLHTPLYLYNRFTNASATLSCRLLGFVYIAPVASGFMVVNLAIDAALAMAYPLKYKKMMTKTKVAALSILAWILASSLTMPVLASSSLDVKVEDLNLCPPVIVPFLPLLAGRFTTALLVIVLSAYLYWSAYKIKKKIKYLTGRDESSRSLIAKLKKNVRLSITLLLIITVDCFLRISRPAISIIAGFLGLYEIPAFLVILAGISWLEFINHPVVYGLMLHDVYQTICCKNGNTVTPV